jgi:hypothetical protein
MPPEFLHRQRRCFVKRFRRDLDGVPDAAGIGERHHASATGENLRLMKFAGQRLIASGKVFQRSGSRALVIEKIEAAPASK